MAFTHTGRRAVQITGIEPIRSPYDLNQWALSVVVQDMETGDTDDWVGEYSDRYVQGGPHQGKTNKEVTEITLNACGGPMGPGNNILERASTLIGRQTFVNAVETEKSGKKYINIKYIGDSSGGRNRQVVSQQEFLMGIGAMGAAPQAAPAPAAAPPQAWGQQPQAPAFQQPQAAPQPPPAQPQQPQFPDADFAGPPQPQVPPANAQAVPTWNPPS